jgi:hypothetical protein
MMDEPRSPAGLGRQRRMRSSPAPSRCSLQLEIVKKVSFKVATVEKSGDIDGI